MKLGKRNKKKQVQQFHATRKFFERCGIYFSKAMNNAFVKKIQRNEAKLLYKQSNRVSIFEVDYHGKKYECVYDKNRKQIVTVLNGLHYQWE